MRPACEPGQITGQPGSCPGKIPAGSKCSAMLALTDVLATFADFFEQELPANSAEDSFSFLGAMLNESPRQATRTAMVHDSCTGVYAIRKGDWKLILSQAGGSISDTRKPDPNKPAGGNVMAHASTHRVYLRKGGKGTRLATVIDSPYLPENKVRFKITEKGVEDAEET